MPQKAIAFLILSFATTVLYAEQNLGQLLAFARRMEIAPMPQAPAWLPETEPCFSIAWLSDFHIIDEVSRKRAESAFATVRDTLKPNGVFITGDNCGLPAATFDLTDQETKKLDLARNKWFQDFVKKELPVPNIVIPGDNWPWAFTQVFGPDKFSFDFSGFHFVFMSMDEQARGHEGCQRLLDSSIEWLGKDLEKHAEQPTVFVMHEPLMPPTFLDANAISEALNSHSNVLLALGGHLHLDLQFKPAQWTQWCCPSVGRSHRPAFKLLEFHKTMIVMTSYELDNSDGTFKKAMKWQSVCIPKNFQDSIKQSDGFKISEKNVCPNQGCQDNQDLAVRAAEIKPALVRAFFNQNRPQ